MARKVLSDLDFNSTSRILNLPAPLSDDEPARMAELNNAIQGLAWKDSCRVATTANINLSSPGSTIDGITLTSGDRVLVKDQTTQSQNGIYIFNGGSSAMTRATDADTANELEGAVVTIEEGTANAGTTWRQTQVNFTLGTNPVIWTNFGASVPDASETVKGIAELATQAETDAGTDDARIVTPLKLANWSGRIRKYTQTIGDGTSTQIDVTHNFGTRDVLVEVYHASSYDTVFCDVTRNTVNVVRLNFASAPATNSLRVVIIG